MKMGVTNHSSSDGADSGTDTAEYPYCPLCSTPTEGLEATLGEHLNTGACAAAGHNDHNQREAAQAERHRQAVLSVLLVLDGWIGSRALYDQYVRAVEGHDSIERSRSQRKMRDYLQTLQERGLVERRGQTRATEYRAAPSTSSAWIEASQ